jgi:hypothetical protein
MSVTVIEFVFALAGVILLFLGGFGVGHPRLRMLELGLACLSVAVVLLPLMSRLG